MPKEPSQETRHSPGPPEKRGLVTDVVVPVIASGVGGAVSAAVANKLQSGNKDK